MQTALSLSVSILLLSACSASSAVPIEQIPSPSPSSSSVSSVTPDVTVLSPAPDSVVKSPVTVTGTARNVWFFEGSLPVEITNADGTVLAEGPATTEDDWMSDGMHPFSVELSFSTKTAAGFIIIKKDNPSGDPERDAEVKVPVRFETH